MKKITIILLLYVFVAITTQAGTLLTFDVKEEFKKSQGDEVSKEENSYELYVYMDETTVEETSPAGIRIWDFANNEILSSNKQRSAFTSSSLFSDLGFRVYEFQNRITFGRGVEKNLALKPHPSLFS